MDSLSVSRTCDGKALIDFTFEGWVDDCVDRGAVSLHRGTSKRTRENGSAGSAPPPRPPRPGTGDRSQKIARASAVRKPGQVRPIASRHDVLTAVDHRAGVATQ